MQKDNNKDKAPAKVTLAMVYGSMDFFRFLQEHSRDRLSRFEAYLYMLDKACSNYRPHNIDAKWIPAIGEGQFFITKTELAADWHWHRATVRDFLAKLTEFGCIVIEEHLKGILCTMTRLVMTVSPSVAISSSFEAMVKYTMYSWADGKISSAQVTRLIGQVERGAKTMLTGSISSNYTKKQLDGITKLSVHYAIESIIASHPGNFPLPRKSVVTLPLSTSVRWSFLMAISLATGRHSSHFSTTGQRWHLTCSWNPCACMVRNRMTFSGDWQRRLLA